MTLMEYLRGNEVYSVKHGCDYGECGSCGVLINGSAMNSCLILMHTVAGKSIETVESFAEHGELHPIQKEFINVGAIQCGYCTPSMILSVESLLRWKANPDEGEVRDALAGNLCRCTGYVKPVEAALNCATREES